MQNFSPTDLAELKAADDITRVTRRAGLTFVLAVAARQIDQWTDPDRQ